MRWSTGEEVEEEERLRARDPVLDAQAVADAFCAGRLDDGGHAFGTLPPGADLGALIDRHDPAS